MRRLIKNATITNDGKTFKGSILWEDDLICGIYDSLQALPEADITEAGNNLWLIPGIIDEHVHFREPGLTAKADISTESQAAAAGGVTSYFDMPNTKPTTTSLEAWKEKMDIAKRNSIVNYAFFYGATNDNVTSFTNIDRIHTPGIKLFMGASTGNMLVDNNNALQAIFNAASPMLIMAHCEDTNIINTNTQQIREQYGAQADIRFHSIIRSEECCVKSTQKAIQLAQKTGARLHIAHISTATELELITNAGNNVTGEACLSHILYCADDYPQYGARIKCNPAVKTKKDLNALREALSNGKIQTIATDHAPHLLSEKQGGCLEAASGIPMIQFSLPAILTLSDKNVLTIERVVELMCHNPAKLFGLKQRGFLRPGYKADFVLLRHAPHTIRKKEILSKCKWSPLEGQTLTWEVEQTVCNGRTIYNNHVIQAETFGEALCFDHND